MRERLPRSFKENIRNMVTFYSIVPVIAVTCLSLLILFGLWRYFTSYTVQKESIAKAETFEELIEQYSRTLDEISRDIGLLGGEDDAAVRAEVFDMMYQLAGKTGYRADFYVLGADNSLVMSSSEIIPSYLTGGEYADWGIMHKMNDSPQETVIHVNTVQNPTLCIGKAMYADGETYGYLVAILKQDVFTRFLANYASQSVVTDENGWVFLANNYAFRDNLGRFDREACSDNGFLVHQDHWYYITRTQILGGKLFLYSISDTQARSYLVWVIVLMMALVFGTIIIFTHFSINRMAEINTRDVEQIATAFAKVQEGNLDNYLDIDSSIEFKTIADSYNLMLDSLKEQIANNKEMAEHVAFAQVKQLESQFNPHFIFNTLDNIRFMMKLDEKSADKMIVALSKILRYSISDAGEMITVEQDLSYMESYLTIVKIRFNRRLTYNIEIEDRIMNCFIPKLLVQPLVENAIKYGFTDKDELHVSIRGYEKQDKLIFVCEDNGSGIEKELLEEIRENLTKEKNESSHLGLYNIHRRIHLLYKDKGDFGVRINSKKGEGAIVTLVLPVER